MNSALSLGHYLKETVMKYVELFLNLTLWQYMYAAPFIVGAIRKMPDKRSTFARALLLGSPVVAAPLVIGWCITFISSSLA